LNDVGVCLLCGVGLVGTVLDASLSCQCVDQVYWYE